MVDALRRIINALVQLESEQGISIIYACESGSRAWGFPSNDSDYDVRFIYHRPASEYLKLKAPRDVIELPIDDDLDINGWDIYKACELLRKTNPPLLEWLGSQIVYKEESEAANTMRELSQICFNPRACAEHYLSMTTRSYKDYINNREKVRKKKYLYALRPILCAHWVLLNKAMPPTLFEDVIDGVEISKGLCDAIRELIASKRDERETSEIYSISIFNDYISKQLEDMPNLIAQLPSPFFPTEKLDSLILSLLLNNC